MKRGTKIAIIISSVVVGLLLVGVVTCVGIGAYWIQNNAGRIGEQSNAAMTEGETHGRGRTKDQCLADAVPRGTACEGFDPVCQAGSSAFLRGCLLSARPSADFCEGVPRPLEVMETGRWAAGLCTRWNGAERQSCISLASEIQVHCITSPAQLLGRESSTTVPDQPTRGADAGSAPDAVNGSSPQP